MPSGSRSARPGGWSASTGATLAGTIAANPNCYEAWTFAAWQAIHMGDPELALARIAAAQRLDPVPANGATALVARCAALLFAERIAEAVEAGNSAVTCAPRMPHAHIFHAAALGLSGDLAAARQQAAALLRLQPDFTLRFATTFRGVRDDAMHRRLIEGLRRAGIPE